MNLKQVDILLVLISLLFYFLSSLCRGDQSTAFCIISFDFNWSKSPKIRHLLTSVCRCGLVDIRRFACFCTVVKPAGWRQKAITSNEYWGFACVCYFETQYIHLTIKFLLWFLVKCGPKRCRHCDRCSATSRTICLDVSKTTFIGNNQWLVSWTNGHVHWSKPSREIINFVQKG